MSCGGRGGGSAVRLSFGVLGDWGPAVRFQPSVGLPLAGGAMCGYHGKRRARSLTGGVDSLLDVRGESAVPLAGFPSGNPKGDGAAGGLVG